MCLARVVYPLLCACLVPTPRGLADVTVNSKILDAVTGKPLPAFVLQHGQVDAQDPKRIDWTYYSEARVEKANADGSFRTGVEWASGRRIRILAPGYAPQVLLAGPPPEGTKEVTVIVWMTRGREVAGTIRDAKGKPVAEAAVFLVGQRQVNIAGGKAFLDHTAGEDKTVTRTLSADDGRYAIAGAEDDDRLVVSAPGLDFWAVPLPIDPNAPCDVRLPEPGRLTIRYDVPGAAEGTIRLHMITREVPGWDSIDHSRDIRQANGTTQTLAGLTPGSYAISRTRDVHLGDVGYGARLDIRKITIKPGGEAEAVFVRDRGAAVTGRVDWPGREESAGAFLTVKPGVVTDDPLQPTFDALKVGTDGAFTTERLPPGDYTIIAQAPIPMRGDGRFRHTFDIAAYMGTAKVTVPAEGVPKPVSITLKWPGEK